MPDLTPKMLDYYERRAPEYESIYSKSERRNDLVEMERWLLNQVKNRYTLELACGTGYWTRRLVKTAKSVHATDGSQKLADMAKNLCTEGLITSSVCNAYNIPLHPQFDCVVAGFFYSHVPVHRQQSFLQNIRNAMPANSLFIMFDNRFVKESNTELSRTDENGNTYQVRQLQSGEQQEVIKNFPTREQLIQSLELVSDQINVVESQYFWMTTAILKS